LALDVHLCELIRVLIGIPFCWLQDVQCKLHKK